VDINVFREEAEVAQAVSKARIWWKEQGGVFTIPKK